MGLQVGATTPGSIVPLARWLCEESVAVLLTVSLDCWAGGDGGDDDPRGWKAPRKTLQTVLAQRGLHWSKKSGHGSLKKQ